MLSLPPAPSPFPKEKLLSEKPDLSAWERKAMSAAGGKLINLLSAGSAQGKAPRSERGSPGSSGRAAPARCRGGASPPGRVRQDAPSRPFGSTGLTSVPLRPGVRLPSRLQNINNPQIGFPREEGGLGAHQEGRGGTRRGWSPERAAGGTAQRGEAGVAGGEPTNLSSNCHSLSPAREGPGETDGGREGRRGEGEGC